jgi:NADH:ubiquinone oxidoreductase subunit 5 (subunit L)/multisubunit Na+/H+ antiporter MnhA subunit
MQSLLTYSLIIGGFILLIMIAIRIRKIFEGATEICHDTLKNAEGKWSMPRIMMVIAFNSVLVAFFYDLYKQVHLNEFATIALLTVAVTGKIADAKAKQIDPTVLPPKE